MKFVILLNLLMLFLLGCNTPGNEVTITSGGITTQALFSMDNKDIDGKTVDLGEHILTNDPLSLTVRVYNKTQYPYTELDLEMSAGEENSPSITFAPTPDGEISFPGEGGTCSRILAAKTACEVKLLFAPRDGRRYLETLKLKFKNFVDPEEHTAFISLLAGMPASLVFTNDKTQYTFGELVGTAQLPVVERAEAPVYEEELEIVNAGGLIAKKLKITPTETCTSTETNNCPTGMFGAYKVENSCPLELAPGEKCKVKIIYSPKNQDPTSGPIPTDIYEINYRATINFSYIKDPTNATAALNAYFRSISSNIEARFKVALANVSFETPIVAGNRDVRSFRVNNLGYREGEIQAIAIRDSAGTLMATCKANATSDYLDCSDASDALVPLSVLPFSVKDRNACLTTPSEPKVFVAVGEGCIFDLYFQPSLLFTTDMNTEFLNLQPEVVFDSNWKGVPTIKKLKMFNLSAKSKAAARIELDRIRFDGGDIPFTGSNPWVSDMGRLTLQSPSFYKRKALVITFKNNGSVPATNISIRDGSNRSISIGGSGVNLGAKSIYYYASATASESTCSVVGPGESCSITMMFAPVGMDTNAEEDANMFDGVGLDARKYKGFKLTYDSGSLFSDNNRENAADLAPSLSEARIQAELVRKGMLMEIADDTRNVTNFGDPINAAGDEIISHVYLQNIGTGPIPYIRLLNPPSLSAAPPSWNVTLIPTVDPASLGADFDCLNIVDEDTTYTVPANADPSTRIGNYVSLAKDKSCVYTVRMQLNDRFRHFNASSCNNTMPQTSRQNEATRLWSRDLETAGGMSLYEFCLNNSNFMSWDNIAVQYYDGDTSDPALPPTEVYGRRLSLATYTFRAQSRWTAKLIPYAFTPFLTSTLYRPEINYPTISGTQTAKTVPEHWFYGSSNNFNFELNDASQNSPVVQGDESRFFVPLLPGFADRANYDYIFYVGSFPEDSPEFSFPLGLRNFGNINARLLSYTVNPDPSFTVVALPTVPMNVISTTDVSPLNFKFNPSTMGEHRMEITYTYETGRHTDPLIYRSSLVASNLATAGKEVLTQKILVIAHVQQTGTHPQLSMDVQDYDVLENPGSTPTESLQAPVSAPLSWNTHAATSNLTFDTIKLTNLPTAYDVYAKKRVTLTNNTAYPVYNLTTVFRVNNSGSSTKIIPSSFTTVTTPGSCTSGMTLGAFSSCTLTFRYQPTASDTSDNFYMTLAYNMAPGQYFMQNSRITLLPRSPGNIVAFGKTLESINYKATSTSSTTTRSSYPLSIGTSNTLNVSPKIFKFEADSGGFQKLEFRNAQSTKASLLLSYQKYVTANSLRGYSPVLPAPTSLIPAAGEYRTLSGQSYVPIANNHYDDGSERMLIEASKGCLFGDDENDAGIPAHQKGFNNSTTLPCYILVTFKANFEYLRKVIAINNGDDMRATALELWYFSVNRTSTASLWLHLKGTINPDTSTAFDAYNNVQAFDNKTVSFSTMKMSPSNPSMGNIVGLRVLMSSSSTGLNDPYSTGITSYVDIKPYDPTALQFANFLTGLSNGQYFYFRVVAIRKDARFVDANPKRFVGLAANEYLSAASNNATPLKVLVPPVNHYYFHAQKLLVEKSMYGGITYDPYLTAANRCALRPKLTIKDPSNILRTYQLINRAAWDLLMDTPAATSYPNLAQTTHWLGNSPVSIDALCSSMPGFIAGQSSQMLDGSSTFYIRNSSNAAANVNYAIGGVPGTTKADYDSYIDGAVAYGSSRCMVTLP